MAIEVQQIIELVLCILLPRILLLMLHLWPSSFMDLIAISMLLLTLSFASSSIYPLLSMLSGIVSLEFKFISLNKRSKNKPNIFYEISANLPLSLFFISMIFL
uniref:NADH dehydrogenase subunit 4 n=1 Tax=Panagrolaimus sp. PS1159 TaxID=55785 RepID=A0AC35F1K4_9BILA